MRHRLRARTGEDCSLGRDYLGRRRGVKNARHGFLIPQRTRFQTVVQTFPAIRNKMFAPARDAERRYATQPAQTHE